MKYTWQLKTGHNQFLKLLSKLFTVRQRGDSDQVTIKKTNIFLFSDEDENSFVPCPIFLNKARSLPLMGDALKVLHSGRFKVLLSLTCFSG